MAIFKEVPQQTVQPFYKNPHIQTPPTLGVEEVDGVKKIKFDLDLEKYTPLFDVWEKNLETGKEKFDRRVRVVVSCLPESLKSLATAGTLMWWNEVFEQVEDPTQESEYWVNRKAAPVDTDTDAIAPAGV